MTLYQEKAYHFLCSLLNLGVGFRHENGFVVAVGTGVSPVLQAEVRKWSVWIQHYIPPEGIAPDYRQDGSRRRKVEPEKKTAIQKWGENSVDSNGRVRRGKDKKAQWRTGRNNNAPIAN